MSPRDPHVAALRAALERDKRIRAWQIQRVRHAGFQTYLVRTESESERRTESVTIEATVFVENGDKLMLVADLPGARAEDIDVQYENGVLTLHARVKPRQPAHCTNAVLCEYGVGDYVRTFQVGEGVDAGGITAEVANGVLTLHLPKRPELQPRRIEVKVTDKPKS